MTLLHKLLTTTLLCFAAVLHANAQFRPIPPVTNFAVNGIFYVVIDGGVAATALTDDNNLNGIVIIPEEVVYEKTKYKVIKIGISSNSPEFGNASDIAFLSLPGSIKEITSYAFSDCSKLREVKINEGITRLSKDMFSGCTALDSVSLPSGLETLGAYAFSGCTSLRHIKLPSGLETLGTEVFSGCTSLRHIKLPKGLCTINAGAFWCCSSLKAITLPASLRTVESNVFSGCNSLESISVEEGNENFSSDGTALYNASKTELISFPCGIKEYRIPRTTTSIKSWAFSCCDSLRNIQFDDSTKLLLNKNAFNSCPNLNKVVIGPNVDIEDSPFKNSHIKKLIVTRQKALFYYYEAYMRALICNENTIDTISAPPIYEYESTIKEYQDSATFIPYTPFFASNTVGNSRSISLNLVTNKSWSKVSDIPIDSLHPIVKIKGGNVRIDDIIKANKDGHYIYRYLDPIQKYDITIITNNQAEQIVSTYKTSIRTSYYASLKIKNVYSTRTTLSLQLNIDPNIEVPEKCGIECNGKFYETEYNDKVQSVTIKDLWPDQMYEIYYREPSYKETFSVHTTYPTINTYIEDITPTTYTLRGSLQDKDEDLNVVEEGFTFDGSTISEHSNAILVTGCEPNSTIKTTAQYAVAVKKGNETRLYAKNFYTNQLKHPALTLKTVAKAKAISNTVALICAETNIDERETNVGFEWRRYDAPELVPSSEANCPIIDSTMTGALRNLSENTYYKFRPFYKSNSGKTWYGEWSAFGTADAYVYFDPTVRTFEVNCDNETTATVRAFVIAGSDEIKEQGFEYWKHSSTESTSTRYVTATKEDNHQTIISTGQRMTATLENLEPNTTYSVRAYVTTEHGTTYGEEQIFSTPAPTAIGNVKLNNTQSGEMTVTINKANAQGVDFVVNGTRNEISAKLYSISGTVLSTTSTTDNGSDARNIKMQTQHLQSGMYLLCVTDGVCTKTIRLAIK